MIAKALSGERGTACPNAAAEPGESVSACVIKYTAGRVGHHRVLRFHVSYNKCVELNIQLLFSKKLCILFELMNIN